MDMGDIVIFFITFMIGAFVHPPIMLLTKPLYLKHRKDVSIVKLAQVNAAFEVIALIASAIFLYYYSWMALGIASFFLLAGIWTNAKYQLEREEVDEMMITIQFVVVHAAILVGVVFATDFLGIL